MTEIDLLPAAPLLLTGAVGVFSPSEARDDVASLPPCPSLIHGTPIRSLPLPALPPQPFYYHICTQMRGINEESKNRSRSRSFLNTVVPSVR